MTTIHTDIAVIGAGLTGLTTAYYLKQEGASFRVIEKSDRAGGVIQTVRDNGFQYECGPNSGIIGQPEVVQLFESLGDSLTVEVADAAVKKRYILKNRRWEPLPAGLLSAVRTPLFTMKDKFRILGEPFRRKGKNPEETLDGLVKRRLGNSFLDYAIDPFILGVYAGDPAKLVTRYAFPKLYALEQKFGSFIGGSVRKMMRGKSEEEKRVTREVFSCRGGLQALTDQLHVESGTENFFFGIRKVSVQPVDSGFEVTGIQDGEPFNLHARKVITTVNGPDLATLLPFLNTDDRQVLSSLFYAPAIEVVLGFERWEGRKLDAFGGLIPHRENRDILGILFLSACFKDRAPKGGALLTIFMGGVRRSEWLDRTDQEVKQAVALEVQELMELPDFNPTLFRIIRHHQAIPQYSFESAEKTAMINRIGKEMPGLQIGGNVNQGIGIADRIKQGKLLATNALL